jgi:hypothetical protein
MRFLKRGKHWLWLQLTSYSYQSDYREEQAVIQRIFDRFATRMEGSNPSRYLWRAISQYHCQASARKRYAGWLANAMATAGLTVTPLLVRRSRPEQSKTNCKYLKMDFHVAYQIPASIKSLALEVNLNERYLRLADLQFAFSIFVSNGVLYPELLLKFIFWIATIRPYLDRYRFEYLIQYCEYSAYSSLRKAYLNSQGVKIANVTHGEEFISCRSAFSSFDQYYAWLLTPRSIHEAMHIEYSQGFGFNPCQGLAAVSKTGRKSVVGILWPSMKGPNLDTFVNQLRQLSTRYHVVVRPHPSPKFANLFEVYRALLPGEVSDPHIEGIHGFIDRVDLVIGYLSAVMVQARYRGRDVLYLQNECLTSLKTYHEYYRELPAVPLAEIASHLCG